MKDEGRGDRFRLIEPALKRYGILDFEAYEPIIDAGYRATLPHLPRIKELCGTP